MTLRDSYPDGVVDDPRNPDASGETEWVVNLYYEVQVRAPDRQAAIKKAQEAVRNGHEQYEEHVEVA